MNMYPRLPRTNIMSSTAPFNKMGQNMPILCLKRNMRKLWIARINAAARMNGLSYSKLMHGLKVAGVDMNRKMLAEMAVNDAAGFAAVAEVAPFAAPFAIPPEIALAPNDDKPISNPNTVPLPAMLQILFKSFVSMAVFNSIPLVTTPFAI